MRTFVAYIRSQWMGALALFLVLSGGIAYAADTVGSADIIDNSVASADLRNNGIRSVDVRDASLPNGGLAGVDIQDNTILGGHIVNGSLGTNDYGDDSVTGTDIADESVTNADIVDGTILGGDISNGSLGTNDYGDGSVDTLDIGDDTITSQDIKESSVSGLDRCPSATIHLGPLCVFSDGIARTWDAAIEVCGGSDLRVPTLGEAMLLAAEYDIPNVAENQAFWTDGYFFRDEQGANPDRMTIVRDNESFDHSALSTPARTVCVVPPTN